MRKQRESSRLAADIPKLGGKCCLGQKLEDVNVTKFPSDVV